MAAQRLIAILIALLVVSTMLAVLAPVQEPEEDASTTTTESTTEPEPTATDGETIERRLEIEPDRGTLELDASVGDRLQLIVASDELRQVRIDPLGLLQSANRAAPARFDILLVEPGLVTVNSPDLADPIATFTVREGDGERSTPPTEGDGERSTPPTEAAPAEPRRFDPAPDAS